MNVKPGAITAMTPEEAMDFSELAAFEKLLKKARRAAIAAQEAQEAVYRALDDMCIDPDSISTAAENASNLNEAISCYLCYGEYSRAGILREVKEAYSKEESV